MGSKDIPRLCRHSCLRPPQRLSGLSPGQWPRPAGLQKGGQAAAGERGGVRREGRGPDSLKVTEHLPVTLSRPSASRDSSVSFAQLQSWMLQRAKDGPAPSQSVPSTSREGGEGGSENPNKTLGKLAPAFLLFQGDPKAQGTETCSMLLSSP